MSFIDIDDKYTSVLGQAEAFLLSLVAYSVCPKSQYKAHSLLSALVLYNGYVFFTDWAFEYVSPLQWACEVLFFSMVAVFQVVKKYDYKSHKYNPENVMLAFYKPTKLPEWMSSYFGAPVSSMSVISDGNWYTFRRKEDGLQCVPLMNRCLSKYILIDTGVKITHNITKELNGLIGSPSRSLNTLYFRGRCVLTFREFLNGLGSKWRVKTLDTIPSIYMLRRLRDEGNH